MPILRDPENNETTALHTMVDFCGLNVLEIGCGDGRLTWRYAERAAQVTAIDPDEAGIELARQKLTEKLTGSIQFVVSSLEEFAGSFGRRKFDVAIFSWAL